MSDVFSQNDDDLFNYDPSKEQTKPLDFSTSTSSDKPSSNEIYNHISKNINSNDDSSLEGINGLRVKFSQAVIGSYDFWLASSAPVAYSNTINSVLDQITGGRFSDLYLFNYLEMSIIRRNHITQLLNDTFTAEDSTSSESFKTFMDRIGVNVNDSFVPVYIGTIVSVTQHIIAQERSMYLTLAEKLQVVPNPAVLDANNNYDSIIKNAKSSVKQTQQDLLDSKFAHNANDGFFEKLNNMNNTQVNHVIRLL